MCASTAWRSEEMESLIAGGKDWQLLRVSGSGLEEGLPPLLARDG
jgi:hypothetical protein